MCVFLKKGLKNIEKYICAKSLNLHSIAHQAHLDAIFHTQSQKNPVVLFFARLCYFQKTQFAFLLLRYVVPHGGLFTMIACPHYLFEIISFWGLSLISQDIVGVFLTFPVMGNLTGRSIATTKYYLSKLEDYPKTRKHLIPLFF